MYVSSGGHEEYLCVQAVGYNVYRCTNSRILYLEKSTTTMNKKKNTFCASYTTVVISISSVTRITI